MRHILHRARRIFPSLMTATLLTGCSFAPIVSDFSISYDGSLEDVNNQLLVTNVIRATERAPLYFSNLSNIKGVLNVTLGSSLSAPVGEGKITSTKHFVLGATAQLQTNPTFDVQPLNQQDFTKGILQPLELQYGKLYWDRTDYPEYVLALLFVDKIEIRYFIGNTQVSLLDEKGQPRPCAIQTGCTQRDLANAGESNLRPCETPVGCTLMDPRMVETYFNQPEIPAQFAEFLAVIGKGRVGPGWGVVPDNPRTDRSVRYHSYLEMNGTREDVESMSAPAGGRRPNGNAARPRIIICPPEAFLRYWGALSVTVAAPQIVDNELDVTPQSSTACGSLSTAAEQATAPAPDMRPRMEITVYTRSVEGIIRYLGDIVRIYGDSPENPIKFYIHNGPLANEKISVVYNGKAYSVGPYQDDGGHTIGVDNTLPILALLEQLLNLRKSAKEITSSPTAILVP